MMIETPIALRIDAGQKMRIGQGHSQTEASKPATARPNPIDKINALCRR